MKIVGVRLSSAASSDDAIRELARALTESGAVTPAYADAAVAREAVSPTGLPLAAGAIAVPHADGDFVVAPAIAMAVVDSPIAFHQMGSPDTTLPVRAVFLLAFKSRDDAQSALVSLLGELQSATDITTLRARVADFVRKGSIT